MDQTGLDSPCQILLFRGFRSPSERPSKAGVRVLDNIMLDCTSEMLYMDIFFFV